MSRKIAYKYAYLISFFYVGLGTVSVLSVYPHDFLHGDWIIYCLAFTLPVSAIGIGIRYADPSQYLMIISIQILTFLFVGWIIFRLFLKKKIVQ
ncbi:hypothetical protein SAMN05518672_11238 [Chitinophaga sp. CF118]|uniref:hypothetical protein n=1 Tax=Chitinophaga sp. CF118 TaxID=1884367 RepID=UPI0008F0E583|nr:hypothetical protein [Chitinophaga sp. CF118]SFE91561.1 hypothetical protein SAMN05518672_11238 [Chitinophaga sp. CF118]